MIKQNVIIINIEPLYLILDELKLKLSFNCSYYESEKKLRDNKTFDTKNLFFVSRSKNLLDSYNIDKKNIFIYPEISITLTKFIQEINILMMRQKYNYQSKINIKNYILDLNSRIIHNDKESLRLTEKEIGIIIFLNSSEKKIKNIDLQKEVWKYSPGLETHTVETHIYRLRKKIREKFGDTNFIVSEKDGYLI